MKIVRKSKDNGLNFWKAYIVLITQSFYLFIFCGVCSEEKKKKKKKKEGKNQHNLDFENRQFSELK